MFVEGALSRARMQRSAMPESDLLLSLEEVVDALDRQIPQVEWAGEAEITADANRLREHVRFIASRSGAGNVVTRFRRAARREGDNMKHSTNKENRDPDSGWWRGALRSYQLPRGGVVWRDTQSAYAATVARRVALHV